MADSTSGAAAGEGDGPGPAGLVLPDIGTLTQRQQRGMDCVWCGVALDNRTAIDLGPRRLRIADWITRWFPRACPATACAGREAAAR